MVQVPDDILSVTVELCLQLSSSARTCSEFDTDQRATGSDDVSDAERGIRTWQKFPEYPGAYDRRYGANSCKHFVRVLSSPSGVWSGGGCRAG